MAAPDARRAPAGPLRGVASVATAMAVVPAVLGLVLRDRALFLGGFTLVALCLTATGAA